ncbi:flagellar hook-length control protein FliK [Marinomonas mediterranea]|jgi:Flagellar hook-length control protein|uniref:Flagellar hook-length control protein-like protein n=1 Tax=Marinomonas mediterranea (strain ATCC 700492 / JCM 21426 / NBRC 103028 / MMB-1) TaxID=717774 RepID=F2K3K6_MARM1|nr:flagellar hook-length control protein FliK [Marinomonas mediterranea]ADZ92445.1 Flagellar hook-length control protein-like protein [Marinomonas mediterranea MMB-1]WCN18494.1 hypothetical protein GV053_16355 [Marinomonas mediterranea MMB-1]
MLNPEPIQVKNNLLSTSSRSNVASKSSSESSFGEHFSKFSSSNDETTRYSRSNSTSISQGQVRDTDNLVAKEVLPEESVKSQDKELLPEETARSKDKEVLSEETSRPQDKGQSKEEGAFVNSKQSHTQGGNQEDVDVEKEKAASDNKETSEDELASQLVVDEKGWSEKSGNVLHSERHDAENTLSTDSELSNDEVSSEVSNADFAEVSREALGPNDLIKLESKDGEVQTVNTADIDYGDFSDDLNLNGAINSKTDANKVVHNENILSDVGAEKSLSATIGSTSASIADKVNLAAESVSLEEGAISEDAEAVIRSATANNIEPSTSIAEKLSNAVVASAPILKGLEKTADKVANLDIQSANAIELSDGDSELEGDNLDWVISQIKSSGVNQPLQNQHSLSLTGATSTSFANSSPLSNGLPLANGEGALNESDVVQDILENVDDEISIEPDLEFGDLKKKELDSTLVKLFGASEGVEAGNGLTSNAVASATQSAISNTARVQGQAVPSYIMSNVPNSPEWAGEMSQKVSIMKTDGIKTAHIHLDPPELGSLTVKVQVDHDGNTQVSFVASSHVARDAIESQLSRLREMLAQQGMNLDNVDVDVSSGGSQAGSTSKEGNGQGRASSGSGDDTNELGEDVRLYELHEEKQGIDYYA